jgi:PAS domain S-box-containing protein
MKPIPADADGDTGTMQGTTPSATSAGDQRQTNSLTLALIYAAFAGGWILFSDQILVWLFSDPASQAMASTFKGLLFVMVTTLLLYGLMRRLEGGATTLPVGKEPRWPAWLMVVLVVGLTAMVIQRSLARGESLAVAAWIGAAGLLILITLGAVWLILRQRAQLDLAQATRKAQDERLRALKLLAAIADSSEDAIFALDMRGRFVMANRVVQTNSGKTMEELLGKDESSLYPPEVAAVLIDDNQWVLAHGVSRSVEETLPLAAGERTLSTTRSPLRDQSGKIIGLLGISRDITERKAAEDALRASELRFHDIVNASADWIWETDAKCRYTYASESVRDMMGYTPAEILGKTPFDLMPPPEAERVRGLFEDIMARRVPFRDLDNINLRKDGSLLHVYTNGTAILAADGALLGYRGLDRDVTEQRLAQLALEETGHRLRTLVNALPDLVWLKDINGVYLTCNPRFEAFFGAREADIIGKTDHDFVPAEMADYFRAHDLAAIAADGPSSNEEEVTFACDGHREILHTIKTPILDSAGQVIGVLGISRDITARKTAEDELRRNNDELQRFNRATVGRELVMVELKKQVNTLARELGREPPYPLSFLNETTRRGDA